MSKNLYLVEGKEPETVTEAEMEACLNEKILLELLLPCVCMFLITPTIVKLFSITTTKNWLN